jgi:PAS domain S-box-containing protein
MFRGLRSIHTGVIGSEGDDVLGQHPHSGAGRLAGWLFLASGFVTVVNNYVPGSEHLDVAVLNTLGLIAIALGAACFALPWSRWPARTTMVTVPVALAMITLGNIYGGVSAYSYGVYFVVVFVWVGVTQPPKTGFVLLPFVLLAYLVPGFVREGLPDGSLSSVTVAVPVCVLVAEVIARAVRRAEYLAEATREAEERFRLAFENAPIGMALVAADGRFLRVNRQVCEIIGYTPEQLLTMTFQDVTHPDDLEADLTCVAEMLAGVRRTYSMEKRYVRADGDVVWVELSVSLVRDPEGQPQYFVSQIEDITEKIRTRQVLEEARDAAEAGARAKAEFLANMSHEIRTPLNAIVGVTTLLLDDALDPGVRARVRTIQASSDHLLGVVNEILDFSKIEAGGIELDEVPVDLRVLAQEALNLVTLAAEAKGLRLTCEIAPEVPPMLMADGGRLRQVLANLLSNAVKFTPEGRVTLRVAFARQPDPVVEFSVEDTGVGIPFDRLGRLFQPFSQVDASTTRVYGGTGLGLAICRYLVERMGGFIWVRSEEGEGSVFGFALPARGILTPAPTRVSGTLDRELAERHPLRILVVDDDLANREVAKALLERMGYAPDVACDGREAVGAVQAGSYDLVLMDVHMPTMDGLAAAAEIVATVPRRPRMVALTGSATEDDRRACLAAGFDEFMTKPMTVAQLVAALERAPVLAP